MQTISFKFNNLLLATFTVFLLSACDSKPPVVDKKSKEQVRPAKLIKVYMENNDNFLNYPAIIKSQKLRKLAFEIGGTVKEVPVIEAQMVNKGDVLAKLDQRDLLAQLKSAQAQFENANTEYHRGLRLMKEDAIAKSELDKRKSQNDVSKSQLDTAQKALENSLLIAPFSGAIAKVSIKKFQVIQAGTSAIDILGIAGFEAKINLPSSIMAKTNKQKEAAMDSYLVLDAAPNHHIPAIFKEATLEADTASQTYEITFTFNAPDNLNILPGMNAILWFRDPSKSVSDSDKIRIPLTAIATNGDVKYVWVVDNTTMKVSKRYIIVEADVGTHIGVISGLSAGEVIVSAGVSALSDGMKVSSWSK